MQKLILLNIFLTFCHAFPYNWPDARYSGYSLEAESWLNSDRQSLSETDAVYVSFDTNKRLTKAQITKILEDLEYDEIKLKMTVFVKKGQISYLNEVAKHFSSANRELEEQEQINEKLQNVKIDLLRNSNVTVLNQFHYNLFESVQAEYDKRLGLFICNNRDSSSVFKVFCPKRLNLQSKLPSYFSQRTDELIRIQMDSDDALGDFDSKSVQKVQLPSGKWRLWLNVDLYGSGYLPYDHRYFEYAFVLSGRQYDNYQLVHAKSNEVTNLEGFKFEERLFDSEYEKNTLDTKEFNIKQMDERSIYLRLKLPSLVFQSGISEYVRRGTFSGLFQDCFNTVHRHRNSTFINFNFATNGDDIYDFVYNITSIANFEDDVHHIDVELIHLLKQRGDPKILFRQKIVQVTNTMPLFPDWLYAENVEVKTTKTKDGHLHIWFHYPHSSIIHLKTENDIMKTSAILEERCPICFEEFELKEDDDMDLVDDCLKYPCKFPQCRHTAHETCILAALEANNAKDECPMCRKRQNFLRIDDH